MFGSPAAVASGTTALGSSRAAGVCPRARCARRARCQESESPDSERDVHAGNDLEPEHDQDLEALARRFVASSGTDPDAVVVPRSGVDGHTQVETLFSLEPALDADELESMTGLDPEILDKLTRALGLPASTETGRRYTFSDVDLVRASWDIVATFPDREVGFRLLRVCASSLARSAEAAVAAYNDAVPRPL